MGEKSVNHCFPLTGDPAKPEVKGTKALLELYRQKHDGITLYGPTYFAPILKKIMAHAKERQE